VIQEKQLRALHFYVNGFSFRTVSLTVTPLYLPNWRLAGVTF